jgi:hypothetical protein
LRPTTGPRSTRSAALLSAMLRIFPAVLFYGIAVTMFQKLRATRKIDKQSARFTVAAGATTVFLFVLPSVSLGSVTQPWNDFYGKIRLHESGVTANACRCEQRAASSEQPLVSVGGTRVLRT